MEKDLAYFEGKQIRKTWDEKAEKWYFLVIDVVAILSKSVSPRNYWKVLKKRLKEEGSQLVTKGNQLKMPSSYGKLYFTDVADTETIFRLIQSIPSPNAEPFKLWLACVGYERVEEAQDPEIAINQRLKSIEIRKEFTDEWKKGEVKKGKEYAILTDDITFAWAGMTTRGYKNYKSLKENLWNNMTKEISREQDPKGFTEHQKVAKRGVRVAGNARKQIEKETGKKVIKKNNAKLPNVRHR